MSSDFTTPIQNSEVTRLQEPQSVSSLQVARKPDEVQRNEAAAGGQDLPPMQANEGKKTEAKPENVQQVEAAVSRISDFVQNFQRDLRFSIDQDSDRLVVKVIDSETQEVIRQIPSEETLRIARNLGSTESLILREQA